MTWFVVSVFFLAVLIGVPVFVVMVYNQLVRSRNAVANQFSDIDVVLNKRYDLIRNLVEVAKKYLQHEQATLVQVTQARNTAASALKQIQQSSGGNAANIGALSLADNQLPHALGNLQVAFEAYPDLKADTQMLNLQRELSNIETEVARERNLYNSYVTEYNNYLQVFPNHLIGKAFSFLPSPWLEVADAKVREAVKVDFS
mgnify:FL=1